MDEYAQDHEKKDWTVFYLFDYRPNLIIHDHCATMAVDMGRDRPRLLLHIHPLFIHALPTLYFIHTISSLTNSVTKLESCIPYALNKGPYSNYVSTFF